MKLTRRLILKIFFVAGIILTFFPWIRWKKGKSMNKFFNSEISKPTMGKHHLGVDDDGISRVYLSRGGSPENNVQQVIKMMGGIEKFIGTSDIVVLKPNAQWWNQGMTNTDAMKGFIDMVLAIPDFLVKSLLQKITNTMGIILAGGIRVKKMADSILMN